jgi:hypothetical protein
MDHLNTHMRSHHARADGGALLIVVILVACLIIGLAAGFAVRALTGQRKPHSSGSSRPGASPGRAGGGHTIVSVPVSLEAIANADG